MKKLLLLILILLPLTTFGAETYTLLEPLPCIANTGQTCESNGTITKIDTKTYLSYVYKFAIAFAAVAAVVMLMYAGFEYAMTDIISTKSAAKARMYNALMGLATMLASYLILQTIDPRLVQIDTELKPIGLSGVPFNYNDLVMTATDYAVKQSLDKARTSSEIYLGQADQLEREAALLRATRSNAQSSEDLADIESRASQLETQALDLRIKAKTTTAAAAADARYKLHIEKISQYNLAGGNSDKEIKTLYDEATAQIKGGFDQSIKELTALGGPAAAVEFEERKTMYLELYKNEIEAERAIAKYKDFSGSEPLQQKARTLAIWLSGGKTLKDVNLDPIKDTSYNQMPTFTNPAVQADYIKAREAIVEKIREAVPPTKEEIRAQQQTTPTP